MALDFPASPTDGQVFGSYIWSASKSVWQAKPQSATVATTSSAKPTTPNNGDIWIDTSDGIAYFYYDDGTSAQWVEIMSSGVPSLASKADLTYVNSQDALKANLSGGNTFTGNQAFNTRLYLSNSNSTYTNPDPNNTDVPLITTYNSSNSSTSAHSIFSTKVGGASGGDPFVSFDIANVYGWSIGVDNSDSDQFKVGRSWSDVGYNSPLTINTSGQLTMPYQPAVGGYLGAYQAGNTSNYYPTLTTNFIVGITKSGNNRLTVPVAGKYYVSAQQLLNTNGVIAYFRIDKNGSTVAYAYSNNDDTYDVMVNVIVDMAANDYIEFYYQGTTAYSWSSPHSYVSMFKVS